MMFSNDELLIIRDLCLCTYNDERLNDYDYVLLNIADRIEKKLGIE